MHKQETCFDCGKLSPPTNTDNTLTTSFGWRMVRRPDDHGEMQSEWRCQTCWARFKAMRAQATETPAAGISSTPPPMRKKT